MIELRLLVLDNKKKGEKQDSDVCQECTTNCSSNGFIIAKNEKRRDKFSSCSSNQGSVWGLESSLSQKKKKYHSESFNFVVGLDLVITIGKRVKEMSEREKSKKLL